MNEKQRMIMKNWSIAFNSRNPFQDPQTMESFLQGDVYGNSRFKDGTFVGTSRICSIIDCHDHKEVHTRSGSVYEIYEKDVDPEYEALFGDCYKKLGVEHGR